MIFNITISIIVFLLAYGHISWHVEVGQRLLDLTADIRNLKLDVLRLTSEVDDLNDSVNP